MFDVDFKLNMDNIEACIRLTQYEERQVFSLFAKQCSALLSCFLIYRTSIGQPLFTIAKSVHKKEFPRILVDRYEGGFTRTP